MPRRRWINSRPENPVENGSPVGFFQEAAKTFNFFMVSFLYNLKRYHFEKGD
jgi:hypothetical protein